MTVPTIEDLPDLTRGAIRKGKIPAVELDLLKNAIPRHNTLGTELVQELHKAGEHFNQRWERISEIGSAENVLNLRDIMRMQANMVELQYGVEVAVTVIKKTSTIAEKMVQTQ